MQIFWGVEAVYYGIVQVENTGQGPKRIRNGREMGHGRKKE